jgi:hypothetical protein
MLKWIRYKVAVSRTVAAATAKEDENIPKIRAEEKDYYEFRSVPRDAGELGGRESRKGRTINALNAEIKKATRDVAQVHTNYLINEMKKLGILLPDKNTRELWLSSREDYLFIDGSRDIDERELLSNVGISSARAAIRKERKERFEPFKDRAGVIFGFAGFIIAAGSLIFAGLTLSLRMLEVKASHSNAQPPPPMSASVACPPPALPAAPASSAPPAAPASSPPSTGVPPLPLKPQ